MAALPLIVFDVNETLLDLETMEPTFERTFGERSAMRLWFANLILCGPLLRSVHRYRFGRDEDARGYARHQNR